MPIIGSNGRAQITPTSVYLGNINADRTAGVTNRFAFKGAYFEFLFDMNHGGVLVSRFINKAALSFLVKINVMTSMMELFRS